MDPVRQMGRASDGALHDIPVGIKRFEQPEVVLALDRGRFEVLTIGGIPVGMGSYGPGWKWSRCSGPPDEAHGAVQAVGVVLSGRARTRVHEGRELDLTPGDFFHFLITSEFDAWVVGTRPCEILYLSGVEPLVRMLRVREGPAVPDSEANRA